MITNQPTKILTEQGFKPVGIKVAALGTKQNWAHEDGRKAIVRYGLISKTGQSSRGTAAQWSFGIQMIEAGH
jgi:hypothetical protein